MYRNLFLHFLVLTFCICINAISVHAQVYPIQSEVNLIPPYSGNLSDYTSPGSQRISVTLTSNDITLSNYRVKLRITIEGLGITLRSKQNLVTDPFVLEGGSPLTLYGDDLLQYLNPQSLDFIGLNKNEYQRTGKLPEGVYRFIVEVLDYNRGTVVSNKGFTTAWIILNDPPLLNLPVNNFKTKIIDPTNIPFTWTPRHTGSPNAAFTTEYIFRLIEIWPSNRNPNDAFLTQQPFVEVETNQSQFVYGPGEPSLVPGRKYAWQVQARDTEGRDLFKNNGRSEVFVFQFGDAIEMPQNVRKETANGTTISLRWEASSNGEIPERFRVRYRPEGGTIWYEDVTTQYWHTLSGLQNNKPYDIQVRAETSSQNSDYTFNQRHSTTLPIVDENFQCGNPFNIQPPAMTTPLQSMNIGDIFRCADFDVQVTEVSAPSTPGFFSGKGYAKVYLLNRANIEVAFSGTFNTEFQMVTGSFKSTYESGSKMSQRTEEMKKIGEKPPELEPETNAESTLITITGIIDSVYLNNDGKIVVITEDGQSQSFDQKKNAKDEKQEMIVKDAAGNNWTIDKDGNISKADASVAGVYSTRDSLNFVVTFKENEANHYGFDPDNSFTTPQVSQVNDKDYVIAWKSVEQGKQDFVDGFVDQMIPFPNKVAFKIGDTPMSIQPGVDAGSSKIIFPGGFEGENQEMVAYANLKVTGSSSESEVILGKLNVVTYDFISRKVIVVPVNGVTRPDGSAINARLDKIYGQAVAGWEVTIADNFKIDESFLAKLDDEESGNLASYNKKMREFNRQYKNSNAGYDRDAFYIFLIKGIDFQFDAFMPFKRGFGYVFVEKLGNNNEKVIQTIAHELGHGAFNLRHTFDQHSVARGKTKNLMDYGGGEELKKYQWDYVHNPESVIGWLQDDEEGAYESAGIIQIQNSSNLQLDPGNIRVNFKLKDWQKKIDASSFSKKDIADYGMLLFVVRNGEVVYSFSKELSIAGSIEWHGLVSVDEEAMTLDNFKEFTLHIGIVPKEYIANEPFLNYHAFLGSRPESTLLKLGNDEASKVSFLDVIQNIRFTLNFTALEWKKFEKADIMQLAEFDRYAERRGQYLKRLIQLGINTDSVSPIDYLNEHIVSGDFLGQSIPAINIRYLYVLRQIEEMLGRKKIWASNSSEFTRLVEVSPIIQDYARMSSVDKEISDHGMGFAIDFVKNSNIWIDEGENPSIIKFIQLVTGTKLSHAALTAEKSKKIHNDFMERVKARGLTKEQFVEKFIELSDLDSEGAFRLIEQDTVLYLLNSLRNDLKGTLIDLSETANEEELAAEVKRMRDQCLLLIHKLAGIKQLSLESIQFFSKANEILFITDGQNDALLTSLSQSYSTELTLLDSLLNSVISFVPKSINEWNEKLFEFRLDAEPRPSDDHSVPKQIRYIVDGKKKLLAENLANYANSLKMEFSLKTEIYGRDLIDVGFFSLPSEIVNAVKKQIVQTDKGTVYVNWGGDYVGTKDYMHFELRPDGQRKFQIAVHQIALEKIQNYLNEFSRPNNQKYEY